MNDIVKKILAGTKLGYDNMIIDFIKQIVCSYYGLEPELLGNKQRKRNIVKARQVAMYLMSKYSKASLEFIGSAFNKDHSTVVHSKRILKDNMHWDKDLKREVEELDKLISLKTSAIVNEYNIDKNFYFIDMDEFTSIKTENQKAIIFIGYSDSEVSDYCSKNYIIAKPKKHENKGMYILEKNEENKD